MDDNSLEIISDDIDVTIFDFRELQEGGINLKKNFLMN